MNILDLDGKLIWHPFTQEKTSLTPIPIQRGEGAYLYDENGKAYLDLISSWWVNLHGHGNKYIAQKIYEQAMKLEHVIFAGFTHEPAVRFCQMLSEHLPDKLAKFFYSDNGSTSVESALKMSYQYWYNNGKPERKLFLSFDGGYHGDTFGAMSVGRKSGFYKPFTSHMFDVITLPYPSTWDGDDEVEKKEEESLTFLSIQLELHGSKIAALILEPLIQGASGMRVCRKEFILKVILMVRSYGIHVIFDEVMTGFGRTGSIFAFEQLDVIPDFLCLSKGITGGFLPLALTITTKEVYNAFYSSKWEKAFAHGHSYTANPIACAAAIASWELLNSTTTTDSIKLLNKTYKECLALLPKITNIRVIGTICAFEVENAKDIQLQCLEKGLLIRPLGSTLYLLPPYCISKDDIRMTFETLGRIMEGS